MIKPHSLRREFVNIGSLNPFGPITGEVIAPVLNHDPDDIGPFAIHFLHGRLANREIEQSKK
jgi:hypothetical protein